MNTSENDVKYKNEILNNNNNNKLKNKKGNVKIAY